MPEKPHNSHEQHPSAQQWVEKLFSNPNADNVVAENALSVWDTYAKATEHNKPFDEQLLEEHKNDIGVQAKNKLLARIAELSEDPTVNVGDFFVLLDHQALELDDQHDETRYRQFKGLWDLLVAVAKDEELMEFFKNRPHDY